MMPTLMGASWRNVDNKEFWIENKDLRTRLLEKMELLAQKFELLNVPVLFTLGGDRSRSRNQIPILQGNIISKAFVAKLLTSGEDFRFTSDTTAPIYTTPIPAFRPEIKTDDVDCDYLRKTVGAAFLRICRKIYIVLNLVDRTEQVQIPYKNLADWDHYFTGIPPDIDISQFHKLKKTELMLLAQCLNNKRIDLVRNHDASET